ncbi:MAG: Mth938-like domain-containing protein [Gammaproteobacteria bacterium]|nr:Mth938-like domain-containing protein [Gammaproteobacteria bacterium]MCP5423489.1 Mth938-like domain-containing protein [Gammaproteobacteria bacterium]
MRFSLDADHTKNLIRAYSQGSITVNERVIDRSVVVMPERLIENWPPQSVAELDASHFDGLQALQLEIVILGTGAHHHFPHPRVTQPLLIQGIGVEIMSTAAACRTYNIIMNEGRRVAAALLMI